MLRYLPALAVLAALALPATASARSCPLDLSSTAWPTVGNLHAHGVKCDVARGAAIIVHEESGDGSVPKRIRLYFLRGGEARYAGRYRCRHVMRSGAENPYMRVTCRRGDRSVRMDLGS